MTTPRHFERWLWLPIIPCSPPTKLRLSRSRPFHVKRIRRSPTKPGAGSPSSRGPAPQTHRAEQAGAVDCFIALLPRNDEAASPFLPPTKLQRSPSHPFHVKRSEPDKAMALVVIARSEATTQSILSSCGAMDCIVACASQ